MFVTPLLLAALLPLTAGGSSGAPDSLGTTVLPSGPHGSDVELTQSPGRWMFSQVPHVDLWFHGMATVDPMGPGPNPLYELSYPARITRAKEEAGVGPKPLDQRAGYFRDAFRRDPALEVLHFLPIYFAEAGRAEVFQALEALAMTREGIPRAASARTGFGLAAIGSVLPEPEQRILLGEFVAVLKAEWEGFYSAYRRAELPNWDISRGSIQSEWDEKFGPALQPLLRGLDLAGGTVLLTPAIGLEGRIFTGVPGTARDNFLVVPAPEVGGDPRTQIFAMLREISFPLARESLGRGGEGQDQPQVVEELAARAAIRAGALILEFLLPGERPAYQRSFLSRIGRRSDPAGDPSEDFQKTFPLEPSQMEALRETIEETITLGGET